MLEKMSPGRTGAWSPGSSHRGGRAALGGVVRGLPALAPGAPPERVPWGPA
ncbi:hypothetical protein [Nonomuraea turkmeniaca]|uniref:hypothetical protein n=1 Tax=Nonomuraea turkmeniaca TaxID=103838 RepID=UPI001476D1A6|nr:hypothetical protein [Nonomuraea turkmeniaca]